MLSGERESDTTAAHHANVNTVSNKESFETNILSFSILVPSSFELLYSI